MSASWGPSAALLGTLLIAAVLVSRARPLPALDAAQRRRLTWAAVAAITIQAAHFTEELRGGLAWALPGLFGLDPIPTAGFVGFNVAWLLVWAAAVVPATHGVRVAEWPLWFLGLASVVNGVAHPLLAVRASGYFPGLVTSIPAGVAGAVLLQRLVRPTARPPVAGADRRLRPRGEGGGT